MSSSNFIQNCFPVEDSHKIPFAFLRQTTFSIILIIENVLPSSFILFLPFKVLPESFKFHV